MKIIYLLMILLFSIGCTDKKDNNNAYVQTDYSFVGNDVILWNILLKKGCRENLLNYILEDRKIKFSGKKSRHSGLLKTIIIEVMDRKGVTLPFATYQGELNSPFNIESICNTVNKVLISGETPEINTEIIKTNIFLQLQFSDSAEIIKEQLNITVKPSIEHDLIPFKSPFEEKKLSVTAGEELCFTVEILGNYQLTANSVNQCILILSKEFDIPQNDKHNIKIEIDMQKLCEKELPEVNKLFCETWDEVLADIGGDCVDVQNQCELF